MGAAIMTLPEVDQAYAAALARRQANRKNEYVTHSRADRMRAELDGRELPRSSSVYDPEWREAATLGEWADDRIIERSAPLSLRDWPETPFLVTIAAALPASADAAVRVVREAKRLDRAVQVFIYQTLAGWRPEASRFGGDRLINHVLTEWERLRLPERDDDDE